MSDIETRLRHLEDVQAIVSLTGRYAQAVDRGYRDKSVDGETLTRVFTDDATWTASSFQMEAIGRDAVIAMLTEPDGAAPFAMHSFSNPVIEVTGDSARATWLIWVGTQFAEGAPLEMVMQSEDLTYARTADGWSISSIDLYLGRMLLG